MILITKDFPNEAFESKQELHAKLRDNKKTLLTTKRMQNKQADTFDVVEWRYTVDKGMVDKKIINFETKQEEIIQVDNDNNEIEVKAVVNSCGWFDSHRDVHLEGCWDKTVNENKSFLHLQEHKASFDYIISDNVRITVEKVNIQGHLVDALVMYSKIKRKDNPKMFDMYKEGRVKQHSVGMQYIWDKLFLAIDSNHEDDKKEKENYDKYITQVINKTEVEKYGYFWGVAEAKAFEGSAVVFGSNSQTPTLEVTEVKNEPSNDTQKQIEPTTVTQSELGNFYKTLLN